MPRRAHPRTRGFTLPELMAVVAIVGVMAAIAMASLGRSGDAQNSAAFARSLQFAMMTARSATLADGFQRRLNCLPASTNSYCNVEKYSLAGRAPLTTGTWTVEGRYNAGSHATLWDVTGTNDFNQSKQSATQTTTAKFLYFRPDGTICDAFATATTPSPCTFTTGITFYISDTVGTNASNHYKIYVYPFTGMPRMVNNW